jgi:hypothetical protein
MHYSLLLLTQPIVFLLTQAVRRMSDFALQDINVNSSSGQKLGKEKIFSFLAGSGHTPKELAAIRSKAIDYSNAPIISTIDISRLDINNELGPYVRKNLSNISSKKNELINREMELVDEINRLRRLKDEVVTGHEFIIEIEKIKKYTVNADFIAGCIDEYNAQRFDLNNFQVEMEEFVEDDDDNRQEMMNDLDLNGEYQHAHSR